MFSASFPTDIHQQQYNENGGENSLDDKSASNKKNLNILDTNAPTHNSANNIEISSFFQATFLLANKNRVRTFHQRPVPTYNL